MLFEFQTSLNTISVKKTFLGKSSGFKIETFLFHQQIFPKEFFFQPSNTPLLWNEEKFLLRKDFRQALLENIEIQIRKSRG